MGISKFFKKLRGVKDSEPDKAAEAAPSPVHAAPAPTAPAPVAIAVTPKVQKSAEPLKSNVIPVKPKPSARVSPLALTGGAKNQSDWLLLQIGKTGRAFIALAEKNGLSVPASQITGEGFVRHDMTAALLGYRLVLTAYHVHQEVPSLEALRFVRTAMIGMLHRAVDITVEKNGAREKRFDMLAAAEDQFKFAEKEVMEACFQLRGKSKEPFIGFYESLVPAFGYKDTTVAMHERYGSILGELYAKIEAAMAARNHQITG